MQPIIAMTEPVASKTTNRETATEVVEKDFHHVAEGTVISELGIDSLGMLEIIGSMERQLKIQIPDESLSGIETIRDLLEVVETRQPKLD
jgi:acyl carrier protein